MNILDSLNVYGDICSNHHGRRAVYEELVNGIMEAGCIPKIQLFSPETFNREWPLPHTFVPSVFRPSDVDFILPHRPLALKIASVEATYSELLDRCIDSGLPLIISTGGLIESELDDILEMLEDYEPGVCLMHCVSMYPTPPEHCNMMRILALKEFMEDWLIEPRLGYSCHLGNAPLVVSNIAQSLGARQFEYHVRPNGVVVRTPDELVSVTISELATIRESLDVTEELLGTYQIEQADRMDVLKWRKRWKT